MNSPPKSEILRFTEKAIHLARRAVSPYSSKFSKHRYTLPQHVVLLCLKVRKNTTYRGLLDELMEMPRIRRVLAVPAGFGVLLLGGVTAGVLVFDGVPGAVIAVVLAFGSAALLYLVTEELLVKAQQVPETPTSTSLFFAGFLLIFVLDMLH